MAEEPSNVVHRSAVGDEREGVLARPIATSKCWTPTGMVTVLVAVRFLRKR